jgi:hypothetical protein
MEKASRRFVVTFRDQEDADGMLKTDFIGLGKTHSGNDPKVLFLRPFAHVSKAVLMETLDELRAAGALTYVEENR